MRKSESEQASEWLFGNVILVVVPIAFSCTLRRYVSTLGRTYCVYSFFLLDTLLRCSYFHFTHKLLLLSFGLTKISSFLFYLVDWSCWCCYWCFFSLTIDLPLSPACVWQHHCYILFLEHLLKAQYGIYNGMRSEWVSFEKREREGESEEGLLFATRILLDISILRDQPKSERFGRWEFPISKLEQRIYAFVWNYIRSNGFSISFSRAFPLNFYYFKSPSCGLVS